MILKIFGIDPNVIWNISLNKVMKILNQGGINSQSTKNACY